MCQTPPLPNQLCNRRTVFCPHTPPTPPTFSLLLAIMGKLRAKLSQAIQREFDIRRQLGLRAGLHKARGPRGAARASAELRRRHRQARQRKTGWDDLCYELQDMVLAKLSIADLANVRLSGLGATSIASRERLRSHMRRRCAAVRPLWKIWSKGTPKYQTKAERRACMPVEFTSRISRLCVSPDVGGVPSSISEMHALRFLDISRTHHSAFLGLPPPLTKLPSALGSCLGLLELRMSHHSFERIPDCVLRLRNLRRFELEYNAHLKELPDDIGTRLSKLTFINIRGCRKIKKLPTSLLDRLELAVSGRQRHRVPILVTGRFLGHDYLEKTLTIARYPQLAKYFGDGALTGPEIQWEHFAEIELDEF